MESKDTDTNQLQQNSASFFIQYTADNWGFVELQADSNGHLKSMLLGEDNLTFKSSSIYPAYDTKTNQAFWLGIASDNRVYKLAYVPSVKTISTAQLILGINASEKIDRKKVFPEKEFPDTRFSNHVHTLNQQAAEAFYTNICRKQELQELEKSYAPSFLITKEKIASYLVQNTTAPTAENSDVRVPDATERRQLLGDDFLQAKTQEFQNECNDSYIQIVKNKLEDIIKTHPSDYFALKKYLKIFLNEHWQNIKGTPLSYTSLHSHPVTMLLIEVAEKLAELEGEPAISYLMPDIYTKSQQEDYVENLDSQSLVDILKTHILDESGRYLIPVKLLLEITKPPHEKQSSLMKDDKVRNPYFDASLDPNNEHEFLTSTDIEQLYRHSADTQALKNSQDRFFTTCHDSSTLLGQLKSLLTAVRVSDEDEGTGSEYDAGDDIYTAAPNFMRYYRRLHPMPIHVTERVVPAPNKTFGPNAQMGYVLVRSGPDAGLYFRTRYNRDESLQDTWHSETLCTAATPARYPITVMLCDSFTDTKEFRETLSQDSPTLIHVIDTEPGSYQLYGKKAEGSWEFTTITDAGSIVLPEGAVTTITQPPSNIPTEIYDAIKKANGHHETDSMLGTFLPYFPNSSSNCSLEQLKVINAQTDHLDIREFKFVPKNIRLLLCELWDYLQNPGANISATMSTKTCMGEFKNRLSVAILENSDKLSGITWSKTERENEYTASLDALCFSRNNLDSVIKSEKYQGVDFQSPSPRILNLLKLPLKIRSHIDFKWFCHFPPETICAFLDTNQYSEIDRGLESPLDCLRHHYNEYNALATLLLEIPTSAYAPIIDKLDIVTDHSQFNDEYEGCFLDFNNLAKLVDYLTNNDKKLALLRAIKKFLPEILSSIHLFNLLDRLIESDIYLLLDVLGEELYQAFPPKKLYKQILELKTINNTFFLKVIQERINVENIQNPELLSLALWERSDEEFNKLLLSIKGELSNIITNKQDYNNIILGLTETQSTILFDSIERVSIRDARSIWHLSVSISDLSTEEITNCKQDIAAWLYENPVGLEDIVDFYTPQNAAHIDKWTLVQELAHEHLYSLLYWGGSGVRFNYTLISSIIENAKSFNDPINALLPIIIDFPRDTNLFKKLLIKLNKINCEKLLNHIQGQLAISFLSDISQPIEKEEKLYDFICSTVIPISEGYDLSEDKALLVLEAIKPQIPLLLQSPCPYTTYKRLPVSCKQYLYNVIGNTPANDTLSLWQITLVLLNYIDSAEQSPEKFENILQNFTRLFKTHGAQFESSWFNEILKKLDVNSCKQFLDHLQNLEDASIPPLQQLITDNVYLRESIRDLSADKIRLLLVSLGPQAILSIIKINEDSCYLNKYGPIAKLIMIQVLEDILPETLTSMAILIDILENCDEASAKIILNSLKGRLSKYSNIWSYLNLDLDLINRANSFNIIRNRKNNRYRISIFNKHRFESINTGSLKLKLEKYIKSREGEFTFHWDFLCIKWFIYWLMGKQPNVKARDTKVAAATYALHAIKNDEECLVRLLKAETLENTNPQINSYILVGKNVEQKQLYYIDYAGNRTRLTISNHPDIEQCFSEIENYKLVNYNTVSSLLKDKVKGLLPTDAQLAALKEGLLGDIVEDAGVDDIITGIKTPTEHAACALSMQT